MADSKKYDGSQWEHSLRKLATATEAVENPLYSDGTAITAYTIKGNTTQSGTPSPSNPVDVNGVGVRTENLWSENYSGISENLTYVPIYVGNGQFTLSTSAPLAGVAANVFILAGNVSSGASTTNNGAWDGVSRTATAIDGYVTICYRNATANPEIYETMLNSGSTAKPYEPYGYKIPISNGQQTTNIYLGSTQTVRQIKKLVLDGTENWQELYCSIGYRFSIYITSAMQSDTTIGARSICTHQILVPTGETYNRLGAYTIASTSELYMTLNGDTRLASWKSWLAAQYAAGTPVTVWYVLSSATTGIVNEPLRKIGDYADTLSNATSIPTTEGANSISVDTTVQPSEFTATWTGWHDASVKEWDGSAWS